MGIVNPPPLWANVLGLGSIPRVRDKGESGMENIPPPQIATSLNFKLLKVKIIFY
jgi:hypothetical protein